MSNPIIVGEFIKSLGKPNKAEQITTKQIISRASNIRIDTPEIDRYVSIQRLNFIDFLSSIDLLKLDDKIKKLYYSKVKIIYRAFEDSQINTKFFDSYQNFISPNLDYLTIISQHYEASKETHEKLNERLNDLLESADKLDEIIENIKHSELPDDIKFRIIMILSQVSIYVRNSRTLGEDKVWGAVSTAILTICRDIDSNKDIKANQPLKKAATTLGFGLITSSKRSLRGRGTTESSWHCGRSALRSFETP